MRILIVILILVVTSFADTVILKNGCKITNVKIVEKYETHYIIQSYVRGHLDRRYSILVEQVRSIMPGKLSARVTSGSENCQTGDLSTEYVFNAEKTFSGSNRTLSVVGALLAAVVAYDYFAQAYDIGQTVSILEDISPNGDYSSLNATKTRKIVIGVGFSLSALYLLLD